MHKVPISEFSKRRKRLFSQMAPASIAIIKAADKVFRTEGTLFPFRQNNDFYYLTGFPESQAVAIFLKHKPEQYILFNCSKDPFKEQWDGPLIGHEEACSHYGADLSYPIDLLDKVMPELLQNCHHIYYAFGKDYQFDNRLIGWFNQVKSKTRAGIHVPENFVALEPLIHQMRLIKSENEIAMLRYAVQVTEQGHKRAMQRCYPGMKEFELEAELLYEFCRNGCRSLAYESIVAGGANACILHYVKNNDLLRAGELVLVDAGAEYQYYAADVTRTFPVNGKFSEEQKQIYNLVLEAQLAAIAEACPGKPWSNMQECIVRIITAGLKQLGILRGNEDELIENRAYLPFYMHNSGHWLGMNVHDVGRYRFEDEWQSLSPGMIFTIEPGLYISAGVEGVAEKWWNIGVRIEDDILITENGCEILSSKVPKTIEEIEALMEKSDG